MSLLSELTNKLNVERDKIFESKRKYNEIARESFKDVYKTFFELCPDVQAVVWTQYTPYFNDGDECVFNVNQASFIVGGFDSEELVDPYQYDDEDNYETLPIPSSGSWDKEIESNNRFISNPSSSEWAKYYYPKHNVKLEEYNNRFPGYDVNICLFADLLQNNEYLLRELYGEHSAVYVTNDEVIVEEYDHD